MRGLQTESGLLTTVKTLSYKNPRHSRKVNSSKEQNMKNELNNTILN